MKNNFIVLINFQFKSGDTCLNGQIYMPIVDGIFYKPNKFTINSGVIDDSFRKLKGKHAEDKRKFKNNLIKIYGKEANRIGIFELIKEYEHNKNIGFVNIASLLSGYNANRKSNLRVISKNKKLNGALLGTLFRNPSSYKNKTDGFKIMTLDEFASKENLMEEIIREYNGSYKSITKLTRRVHE